MVYSIMLMIRFQRIGRRNDPAFRIIVTEKTSGPKTGKYTDRVGTYNPKTKAFSINAQRTTMWIQRGAQVSSSVHNLLIKQGIISGKTINVLPKKKPILKKEDSSEKAQESESVATTSTTQQKDQETVVENDKKTESATEQKKEDKSESKETKEIKEEQKES